MKLLDGEFLTHNLAESERFYSEILEIPAEYRGSDRLVFASGKSNLIFRKSEIEKPIYHFAFSIPNNQLSDSIQ